MKIIVVNILYALLLHYVYGQDPPLSAHANDLSDVHWHPDVTHEEAPPPKLWPSTRINYQYVNASNKLINAVESAMHVIGRETCVSFSHGAEGHPILIGPFTNKCEAALGWTGENYPSLQTISLPSKCEMHGTVVHELLHSLGIGHEHQRCDRDSFIEVHEDEIIEKLRPAFTKNKCPSEDNFVESTLLSVPYDVGSVMHYSQLGSAKRNLSVITTRERALQKTMGAQKLAFRDVLLVNTLYRCFEHCSSMLCKNGGYPNPRNCNTCKCPPGWGGKHCTLMERSWEMTDCGRTLVARGTRQSITMTVPKFEPSFLLEHRCVNQLKPDVPGKETVIEFRKFNVYCTNNFGCSYAGLEIKNATDQRVTGARFCCMHEWKDMSVITSKNAKTPLILYSDGINEASITLDYYSR